ncbi:MAG: glycosyltransferase family A protein, partial [Planctomycetaceae bacterium]
MSADRQTMISVIIPHFQRLQLLQQTLLSLQQQSFTDWEAIVVDDGSAPPVWTQLQQLQSERVRVLRREDGVKGPSRCRNLGLNAARGEFVLFLDSDDLLGSDCLRARSRTIAQHPDYDFWVFPAELFSAE